MNQINNQTRNNKDLNFDTIEILRQIKKQRDEISTSEGSVPFLRSLSNPTNLTNPQIIATQKTTQATTITPRYIKKEINRIKKRNLFKVKSNININRAELFNNQKFFKSPNISLKSNNNSNINDIINEKGCLTTKGKVHLKPIWEKINLKYDINKKNREYKDIRVNIREKRYARDYIDNTKMVSLYKYKIDAIKEEYKHIKCIQDTQIIMNNKTEEKIITLRENVINSYKIKYIHYLKFLNKTKDKENHILYGLKNDERQLKDDIDKINDKIAKLFENKLKILKWVELQIKLKEKIISVPKYYFDILEQNDNYQIYNSKDELNKIIFKKDFLSMSPNMGNFEQEDLIIDESTKKRILNYKYNLIFKEPEDFMYQFSKLEKNWLLNLQKHDNMINKINLLREQYSEYDESNFLKNEKILIEKLKVNKKLYFPLKHQYDVIKNNNNKVMKKIKFDKLEYSNSELAKTNIYNTFNDRIINNLNFYNLELSPINKKRTSSIFMPSNILHTNIFQLILNLYEIVSQNNFVKFDESILEKNKHTNPIFDIMNYIELVINLLIEEKKKYMNDPKLKEKYKKTKEGLSNEMRKIRILKLIKMKEIATSIKLKKMKEKEMNHQYNTTRKIDFSQYKKLKMINKRAEKKPEIKKDEKIFEPNLKDFLYDSK